MVPVADGDPEPGGREAERAEAPSVRSVHEEPSVLRQVEGVRLVGEVGDEQVERPVPVQVGDFDPHARLRPSEAAEGCAGLHGLFAEAPRAIVHPEVVRLGVVGHIEVGQSLPGEVVADHAEPPGGQRADPDPATDFLEPPAAEVSVEEVGDAGEFRRAAVVAASVGGEALERRVVVHVTRDEQVEMPVRVVVAEHRGGRPSLVGRKGRGGGVSRRVVVPEEQGVGAVGRSVEVEVAVPVRVADRGAHPVAGRWRERVGYRGETQRRRVGPPVLVERVRPGALDEVEVEVPVAVVVQQRQAAAHDLGQEVVGLRVRSAARVPPELHAGGLGDVGEPDLEAGSRSGNRDAERDGSRAEPRPAGAAPQASGRQRRLTEAGPMSPSDGVPASCMASFNSARSIRSTAATPGSPNAASPHR